MKNRIHITAIVFLSFFSLFAQQEKGIIGYDNWLNTWTSFTPNKTNYETPDQILIGTIKEDMLLQKRFTYVLLGDVFIANNAVLTIEPGTVILGDFETKGSLTITKGSKIVATGEQTDPIIFSSNRSLKKPGDWGGITILGDAPINNIDEKAIFNVGLSTDTPKYLNYGGLKTDDNSGILRYVRIEFAGKRTKKYGHLSGLTLAAVGEETVLDNVMVSYCNGNSFNIIGGNLVLDKLVSYRSNKNDYEFNSGTQTSITNSLAVRSPYSSGSEGFRGIYVKAYLDKEDVDLTKPQTNIFANNMSLINVSDDINAAISMGLIKEGIYVSENTTFSIDKSVISGFNPAVYLDQKILINNDNLQRIQFKNTYFNNCNGNIFSRFNTDNEDLESWYGSRAFDNVYSKGPDKETFIDINNTSNPDFRLRINKIIATSQKDNGNN